MARKLWYFEQLNQSPAPTQLGKKRHELGGQLTNHVDSVSTLVRGGVDLHWVELGARYSHRLFLADSERSQAIEGGLSDERDTLMIEVARYVVGANNHFGRLGLGFLQAFPNSNKQWAVVNVETGIFERPEVPWRLLLSWSLQLPTRSDRPTYHLRGEVGKVSFLNKSMRLNIGGIIFWSFVDQGKMLPNQRQEHMFFAFGPNLGLTGEFGNLGLRMFWRLYLDRDNTSGRFTYPSDILPFPDFGLSWSIGL